MSFLPLQCYPVFIRGAAAAHTGNTSETSLRSFTLKANMMGPFDFIEIYSMWQCGANNANAKTATIKFGSTTFMTQALASTRAQRRITQIYNKGVTNAQVGFVLADNDSTGTGTAVVTATEDTTTDLLIDFTATLANAGDSITLDSVLINLWKRP
jgi:hypothetical protein